MEKQFVHLLKQGQKGWPMTTCCGILSADAKRYVLVSVPNVTCHHCRATREFRVRAVTCAIVFSG